MLRKKISSALLHPAQIHVERRACSGAGTRYLKFKACNSEGIGLSGNHTYFLFLEENYFCEFDNNSWSLQKRNDHNCGDPKYKFLMTNKNVTVVMEVEVNNGNLLLFSYRILVL
jgi:hypothetical protein